MSGSTTWSVRRASLMAVALAAVGCGGDPSPAMGAAPTEFPPCMLERRPLVLEDGSELYVEHQDVIRVGDDLLVAGAPSYLWRPLPGRRAERLATDAFVAAYFWDPARAVPKPVSGALASVRVAPLDDVRWGAIMLEVDPDSLPGREIFRGLWYGEYDGERWSRLEAVASPGAGIHSRLSSGLVRAGDRMIWAAFEMLPYGRSGVRLYERVGDAWTHALLPEDRVEQVDLAYLDGFGLWLLVSGYDPGLPGFQKSLRLFRERPGGDPTDPQRWELMSRVAVARAPSRLAWASLVLHSEGATVSWTELGQGASVTKSRFGIGPEGPGMLITLDEQTFDVRAVAMSEGTMVWIVNPSTTDGRTPELRILTNESGRVEHLTTIPDPFPGTYTVRALSPREFVVVGPELRLDTIGVPVRSLLLRLSTSC